MNTKSALPYILAGAAGALVASVMPLLLTPSHAGTKLLPFQGRLTDAAGKPLQKVSSSQQLREARPPLNLHP